MFLDKIVSVDGRFQRSVNINSDIGDLDFFRDTKRHHLRKAFI